jgi:HD-GYP domain-containing protein (c-di-GMP phosphodiesterase class II)
MISANDATNLIAKYLGESLRARHSAFVGFLMMRFAEALGEDLALWEVTGLCHDLDFEETAMDRSRHGMVTAEWLQDALPEAALLAIQSHDHRTGIHSETKLADALRLADAVALGELDVGREAIIGGLSAADPVQRLENILSSRPYLTNLIIGPAQKLSISPMAIAEICREAPRQ